MKLTLATLFVLMTTLGCSTIPLEDVQNATLYFPPQVRYIDEPRFCFAAAERKKALEEYKADGADTLFELVIDSDGKVKRARLLKTHVDPKYHEQMEQHARLFEFTKDTQGDRFRAFYFPAKYRFDATFEWI
jgi:hypothetical protein